MRDDMGMGAGAGRGAVGAAGGGVPATAGAASFLGALTTTVAGALAGIVGVGLVLPTGFASGFTAAFEEGLADCGAALPGKMGFVVGSVGDALAALDLAAAPAEAGLRTSADAPVASFVAGSRVAFDFFSGDFTMCLLWNASFASAAGGFWQERSP